MVGDMQASSRPEGRPCMGIMRASPQVYHASRTTHWQLEALLPPPPSSPLTLGILSQASPRSRRTQPAWRVAVSSSKYGHPGTRHTDPCTSARATQASGAQTTSPHGQELHAMVWRVQHADAAMLELSLPQPLDVNEIGKVQRVEPRLCTSQAARLARRCSQEGDSLRRLGDSHRNASGPRRLQARRAIRNELAQLFTKGMRDTTARGATQQRDSSQTAHCACRQLPGACAEPGQKRRRLIDHGRVLWLWPQVVHDFSPVRLASAQRTPSQQHGKERGP